MDRTRTSILTVLAGVALLAVSSPLWSQPPDAPAGDQQPVYLVVRVPANAVLEVFGTPTQQSGAVRRFMSPPIVPGKNYYYDLRATWKDGDQDRVVEKRIYVVHGKDNEIDLSAEAPKVAETTPAPEPKVPEPEKPKFVVPYVPTPQPVVDKMLELAEVGKDDVVYDLGCGDGRIVVTAAKKYGAKGVGVDINPERVKDSKENAKKEGVEDLVRFRQGDVLKTDVAPASVVTLYLLPNVNLALKPILQKSLKPGSRVVSHDFDMGEDWKPLKTEEVTDSDGLKHTLYLWKIEKPGEEPKEDKKPDVIFVPTPQEVVDKMLELADVKKGDVLYDLGCGDGRIPVTAAKKCGIKAFGFDVDPARIRESEENVKKNDVGKLVTIKKQDIFTLDLSKASVVTLYLLPELNVKLIPQLEKLKPGSRIVSHYFDMEGVKPDKVVDVKTKDGDEAKIYLWTVPLKKEKE